MKASVHLHGFVLLASGCSSVLGIQDFKVADATIDGAESGFCLGPTGPFRVCLQEEPITPFENTSSGSPNTDNLSRCAVAQPSNWMESGQPDSCFLIGSDITITGEMRFTGSRPVVLFAAGSITLNASIEVASHLGAGGTPVTGPGALRSSGAPPSECQTPIPAGNATSGAGGGAGGSFIGKGGDGGGGTSSMGTRAIAALADASGPDKLRPGCPGSVGGNGGGGGGRRGVGGGAIYLVAGGPISINNAYINASGAAGGGGGPSAGGGGAGSGGMIVIHAPMITGTNGVLVANGGAGGGAGGGNLDGFAGAEASTTAPSTVPLGGAGSNGGGVGGDGAAGSRASTNGANGAVGASGAGGGGGGGAFGHILVSTAPSQVSTSPPYVIGP